MSLTNLAEPLSTLLLTFVCTDGTMTSCEIYEHRHESEVACAEAATEIGQRARKLQLPETIVFYCTTDSEAQEVINSIVNGE